MSEIDLDTAFPVLEKVIAFLTQTPHLSVINIVDLLALSVASIVNIPPKTTITQITISFLSHLINICLLCKLTYPFESIQVHSSLYEFLYFQDCTENVL